MFDGNTFQYSVFSLSGPGLGDFIYYVLLLLRVCSKQRADRLIHTINKHLSLVERLQIMLLIHITRQYR